MKRRHPDHENYCKKKTNSLGDLFGTIFKRFLFGNK
jgi:hypothetical protein